MKQSKAVIRQIITKVLSADLACSESELLSDGLFVHQAEFREGRFRFPFREQSLSIVTMGKGTVVTCNKERIEWAKQLFEGLTHGEIFSARIIAQLENYVSKQNQYIAGPNQKYVCSKDDLNEYSIPLGVRISTYKQETVTNLYEHPYFRHALSYRIDNPRPDMLATVAECDGKIVGIAGASADCDLMWQIGIDVLLEYQGRAIGKALVGTLTKEIFNEGITPYYSTIISNLQSSQLAISLGYWPAWIELYANSK